MLVLLIEEVKRDTKGADVAIIAVVDHRTIIDAILQLEAHGDAAELQDLFFNARWCNTQVKHRRPAVDCIFDRGFIGKGNRNTDGAPLQKPFDKSLYFAF